MNARLIIAKEQAHMIASTIRPQIKDYVELNKEKYEMFLQAEQKQKHEHKLKGLSRYAKEKTANSRVV